MLSSSSGTRIRRPHGGSARGANGWSRPPPYPQPDGTLATDAPCNRRTETAHRSRQLCTAPRPRAGASLRHPHRGTPGRWRPLLVGGQTGL